MPFTDDVPEDGVGLALSGGGFRAVLFHVGALRRMTELGVLPEVTRISSVSGGSIVAGRLAEVWEDFTKDPTVESYERLIAQPLREFCRLRVDAKAIGLGILSPFGSAASVIQKLYAKHLMAKRLDELPDAPVFVFNATNMQTGRSFRFSKRHMADYRLGLIRDPRLPVALAVAASSAFPPFLSPLVLEDHGPFEAVAGADLNKDPKFAGDLLLADGGVYDNMGLETVWNRCRTVLVSDAGAPFTAGPATERDWLHQTMRALDVATDQSRALRKRALVSALIAKERAGTYWGIDTDIGDYGLDDGLPCQKERTKPLSRIRTRLDRFDDEEQGTLINWGYALADTALRRHVSELVRTPGAPTWPESAHALG